MVIVDIRLWRTLEYAQDLATPWQGLCISECLMGGLEDDLGGDLGHLGNVRRYLGAFVWKRFGSGIVRI